MRLGPPHSVRAERHCRKKNNKSQVCSNFIVTMLCVETLYVEVNMYVTCDRALSLNSAETSDRGAETPFTPLQVTVTSQ